MGEGGRERDEKGKFKNNTTTPKQQGYIKARARLERKRKERERAGTFLTKERRESLVFVFFKKKSRSKQRKGGEKIFF